MRRELDRPEAELEPIRGHAREGLRTPISQSGDPVSVPVCTAQVHAGNHANLRKGNRKESPRGGALTAVSESRQRIGNNASRSGTFARKGSRIQSAGHPQLADGRWLALPSLPAGRNAREPRELGEFRALAAALRSLRVQGPSDRLVSGKGFKIRGVVALFAPLQKCVRGSDPGAKLRREGRWNAERRAGIACGQGVRSGPTCPRSSLPVADFRRVRRRGTCTRAAVAHNFHVTRENGTTCASDSVYGHAPRKRGTAR
jgi:hypothetical protein